MRFEKQRLGRIKKGIFLCGMALMLYGEEICVRAEGTDGSESEEETVGYLLMEDENDVPVLEECTDDTVLQGLITEGNEAELLGSNPGKEQSAYPCTYKEDWLKYLKERYPDTRDQGTYATCWANTAMSLAELYLITHGRASTKEDLSELHLAYWTYTEGTASEAAGDTGDTVRFAPTSPYNNILNNGGSLLGASQILMRQRGFAGEKVAPYTMALEIAEGGELNPSTERKNEVYLEKAYQINLKGNPELVKEAIVANGAVGSSMYAKKSFYNSENNAYYCSRSSSEVNHSVTLIGWDDDYPAENFTPCDGSLPTADGAWLVRNSWSTTTEAAYESYFWLSYEDTSIVNAWVYEVTQSFPYDNHYYYDSTIHNSTFYRGREYANVFEINGSAGAKKESLDAVSFEVAAAGTAPTRYTVKVYRNLSGTTPVSGNLVEEAITTGTIAFKGQYTVELAEPVILNKGESFSVIVSFDDTAYAVKQERDMTKYGGVDVSVSSRDGQSYTLVNGSGWEGTGENGNLVISAMTTNAPEEEDDLTAFINRMYRCCLEREADEEGRNYWVEKLQKEEQDGAGIAEHFVFSKEMLSGELSNKEFVIRLYNAMMGREPEADGLQYWINALDTGVFTRYEALAGFVSSDEYGSICNKYNIRRGSVEYKIIAPVERFATRFYELALERSPEQEGLYYWVYGLVDQRFDGARIAKEFFCSDEMQKRGLSDEQYVEILYRVMMDRASEADGMTYWLKAMEEGMSRENVLGAFVDSDEFSGICRQYGIRKGSL